MKEVSLRCCQLVGDGESYRKIGLYEEGVWMYVEERRWGRDVKERMW